MEMIGKVQRAAAASEAWTSPSWSTFLNGLLDHDLSMARQTGRELSVFVVRIDGYHGLATSLGGDVVESAMDELLARLKTRLRPVDTLVRSAADQFTIIQSVAGPPQALHRTAKAMLKRLQEPLRLGRHDRCMAASIGIAFYPEDGNSADLLLERAQEALTRTDRFGGNGFCFHSRAAARKVAEDLSRREDLRLALGAGDLAMRFQPVLDLSRSCMTSVSGDLFWHPSEHPGLGAADVRETADHAGLIAQLNDWLADQVFRQLVHWRQAAMDRSISVAMSRAQLLDDRFARRLSARFRETGLSPGLLEVRLDHDLVLAESDHRLRTALQHLADLGVGLTLSGVGEGSIVFRALDRLPLTSMEVAHDLVAAIGRCVSTERMLRALIGFIHNLGLRVRAVGVCSREQLDFLQRHHCDEVSGPLFAPAMEGQDIDRMANFSFRPCFGRRDKPRLITAQHLSMH